MSSSLLLALTCGCVPQVWAHAAEQAEHAPAQAKQQLQERLGTQPVTENHVDLILRVFELEDAQQIDIWSAYDTLTEIELREAQKRDAAIGAHVLATEDSDDWGAADEGAERIENEHEERMREHRLAFYDDVRLFLSDTQEHHWDRFLVEVLVLEELPRTVYPGDHIDLRELLAGLDLLHGDDQSIQLWIDQYTQGLVQKLLERSADRQRARRTLSSDSPYTIDDIKRTMTPARRSAWGVVQHNLDALESATAALPQEDAETLKERFYASSFPKLTRDSVFDRALDGIDALDDLEPEQADELDALEGEFARRRGALVEKQIEAALAASKARSVGRLESSSPFDAIETVEPNHRRTPPPLSEREGALFAERVELERVFYIKLMDLLRPEQQAAVRERVPGLPTYVDRPRSQGP